MNQKYLLLLQEILFEMDEAKKAKNNFIAALSHELRNPLNTVLGSLQLIESSVKELDQGKVQLIQNAKDSGEILLGMISNILDAAKIESKKFDLDPEIVEIRVLFRKIAQINKGNAINKNIDLEVTASPKIPKFL